MRELTQEEIDDWNEMLKLREPTLDQLVVLADQCCKATLILDDKVVLFDNPGVQWDPLNRLDQNHKLLDAVIAEGDCKLFYDDGVGEFFIYRYITGPETEPAIAHRMNLNEAAFEAAMNLWCPEEE